MAKAGERKLDGRQQPVHPCHRYGQPGLYDKHIGYIPLPDHGRKGSVSTTLLTLPATATVNSAPDPEPEPTYYTVTLPSVEGATTDPVAGSYDVESSENFRFYLTLDADYNQSVPVVTTSRGETITPRTSDGAYIVKYVHSDLVISISGIAKNPPPVANAEIQSGTRIFTRDGSLFITTDRSARCAGLCPYRPADP